MRCTHCGICCKQTQMPLSEKDIQLLEKAGYTRKQFVHVNKKSYAQLRNKKGTCIFYDIQKSECRVYRRRPTGCRLYPVIYSVEEGIVTDSICPTRDTVTRTEIKNKKSTLMKLLTEIDSEALKRQTLKGADP
jgi:Fe-S-cluster containining protein